MAGDRGPIRGSPAELLVELDRATAPRRCTGRSRRRSGPASAAGGCAAGSSLPPTRALAADLGVSRGVVVEAYQQLVAEGYLTSRSGGYTQVATGASRPGPRRAPPAQAAPAADQTSATAAPTCRSSRAPPGCARSAGC